MGIRVPKNKVCHELVTRLGNPLISASLPMDTDVEYYTDPEVMYEIFNKQIDAVINSGVGGITPSTIVDCTQSPPELVRLGAGKWSY